VMYAAACSAEDLSKRKHSNFTRVVWVLNMFCVKQVVHPRTGAVPRARYLGGEGGSVRCRALCAAAPKALRN
jgi:hypothetical protein